MEKVETVTRRDFIKLSGILVSGFAIGSLPVLSGCGFPIASHIPENAYSQNKDTIIVNLDKAPELSQVGGSVAITNTDKNIHLIVVKTGQDLFVVALNECPHREKLLGYDHNTEHFICASGKSEFRLDGSFIKGPVEKSLPIFQWYLEDNNLFIGLTNKAPE